jgi:ABC-type glycerol-3-phosphate transport system permease component
MVFGNAIDITSFTLDNYARAITKGFLGQYTLSTVLLSLATCVFVLPLGFLAGYSLARFVFIGRTGILFLFMFSLTIPGLVNLLAIYQAFNVLKLINNPVGLVIVYTASNLPLATWLMRAFILAIPHEIEEASLVDGCTRWGTIGRIVLPLSLQGLGAVAVFVVVNVFQEFIVAQTLITTRGVGVVSQGLRMMQSQYSLDYTALAAGSILVSIVPVGLFLMTQRQFIAGMTAGSVTS